MKAYELINGPDRWTRDRYAATATGVTIGVFDEGAEKFCIS